MTDVAKPDKKIKPTAEELDLYARLVHAEAKGEPFEGQVAVAATVLNRVRDARYPNSIKEVIMQISNGYYQYSPVLNGSIKNSADSRAYRAVRAALKGVDPTGGATGFYNPELTSDTWVRSQVVTKRIGSHVFFR